MGFADALNPFYRPAALNYAIESEQEDAPFAVLAVLFGIRRVFGVPVEGDILKAAS
jgi:hypothetical protein